MRKRYEEDFIIVNGVFIKIRKVPKQINTNTSKNKQNIIYLFPQNNHPDK